MKNRPLITIATVTYNAGATLQRTLQSVACQDYPRIEHLIVDGRSRDDTLPLVQRYVEQNTMASVPHSIRLVCEHDQGLYDAMNKGVSRCSGQWVIFMNAGDVFASDDCVEKAMACAYDADVVNDMFSCKWRERKQILFK